MVGLDQVRPLRGNRAFMVKARGSNRSMERPRGPRMSPNVKQAILNVLIFFASFVFGAVFCRALLSKPNPKDVSE